MIVLGAYLWIALAVGLAAFFHDDFDNAVDVTVTGLAWPLYALALSAGLVVGAVFFVGWAVAHVVWLGVCLHRWIVRGRGR